MRAERGFTLIEILVIILIIGISAGVALLSFGDFGASRRIITAAEELSAYIQLLQQKAILQNSTLGIGFEKNAYSTYYLKNNQWEALNDSHVTRKHYLPENALFFFANKQNNLKRGPEIVLYPSGDMSPFVLHFGKNPDTNLITIQGQKNGGLVITR